MDERRVVQSKVAKETRGIKKNEEWGKEGEEEKVCRGGELRNKNEGVGGGKQMSDSWSAQSQQDWKKEKKQHKQM